MLKNRLWCPCHYCWINSISGTLTESSYDCSFESSPRNRQFGLWTRLSLFDYFYHTLGRIAPYIICELFFLFAWNICEDNCYVKYFFHFVILFDRFFWKLLREVVEGRDHHCRHFVTWLRSLHKKEIITHLSQIVPQFWSCQVISQIGVKQCVVLTASQLSWCFARTKGAISLSRSRSHIKFES